MKNLDKSSNLKYNITFGNSVIDEHKNKRSDIITFKPKKLNISNF